MEQSSSLELLAENQRDSIVIPIPQSTNTPATRTPKPQLLDLEENKGTSLDLIIMPRMEFSQPNPPNYTPYKTRGSTELSSAATLTDPLNIPVLNCEQFKQEGSDIKQNLSNRSIPSQPFWPMIRRREKDPRAKKPNQRPSVEKSNNQSELKKEQEKLKSLKQNLELEFNELETQKNRLEEQRKEYQEYLSNQKMEIQQQMFEIQRKRQSLLIKQKVIERNDVLNSRKYKDAHRCKLELFCYKLNRALQIDEWIKSIKEELFSRLSFKSKTPVTAQLRASKKLIKVKSCDKLRQSKGQSIKCKSRSPRKFGNSLDRFIDRKELQGEHVIKAEVKNITKRNTKNKKGLKKTKSNILEPQVSQISKNKLGKPSKL